MKFVNQFKTSQTFNCISFKIYKAKKKKKKTCQMPAKMFQIIEQV